jgi:hypothetical protein
VVDAEEDIGPVTPCNGAPISCIEQIRFKHDGIRDRYVKYSELELELERQQCHGYESRAN